MKETPTEEEGRNVEKRDKENDSGRKKKRPYKEHRGLNLPLAPGQNGRRQTRWFRYNFSAYTKGKRATV